MALRVGFDLTPAAVGHTGVVRYVVELHDALLRRPDLELKAFATGRGGRRVPGRRIPIPNRILNVGWRLARVPTAGMLVGPIDVLHSTDLVPPPSRAPLVVSIHDLLPLTHPHFYSLRARRDHEQKLAEVRRRAASALVLTSAVGEEVSRLLGIPADRVFVAPPGPMTSLVHASAAATERPASRGDHVLAVGVVTPRKGFDVLARAIALLGPDAPPVVIAGPDGYQAGRVRSAIRRLDPGNHISFVGAVDDVELARLYAGAAAVAHPSLAEGFGIVCIEAMRAGRPVVAADIPAVREAVADAAMLVPPGDPEALAAALRELLHDDARASALVTAGLRRAEAFSWDRTAEVCVSAYAAVR